MEDYYGPANLQPGIPFSYWGNPEFDPLAPGGPPFVGRWEALDDENNRAVKTSLGYPLDDGDIWVGG